MKNNSDLDYFILESCRKSLASKGIYLSHKQISKRINRLKSLYEKFNDTQHNLMHLWNMYNVDPPFPPYNHFFETKKDAINFAMRAKDKYDVVCDVVAQNKLWKVVGGK